MQDLNWAAEIINTYREEKEEKSWQKKFHGSLLKTIWPNIACSDGALLLCKWNVVEPALLWIEYYIISRI